MHVATVLAELLDNDNDGCVDYPNMMTALQTFLGQMGGFKGTIFVQEVKVVPEGVQELVSSYLSTVVKANCRPLPPFWLSSLTMTMMVALTIQI